MRSDTSCAGANRRFGPTGRNELTMLPGPFVRRYRRTRVLVVHLANGVPANDVHVSVDSGGTDYGVHATAAYRFGRPEPTLPQPPRAGAPVKVNGKTLGTPIPLK